MRNRSLVRMAAVGVCASLACCAITMGPAVEVTQGTVLRNVSIVNTRDGSLLRHAAVVIESGRIQKVTASGSLRVSGRAQVIDASGKFLVPGYLDMHTHAMAEAGRQSRHWPLLIANGITGVREMSGSAELIRRAQALNANSAAGRVEAPEIVLIAGDILGASRRPRWRCISSKPPATIAWE